MVSESTTRMLGRLRIVSYNIFRARRWVDGARDFATLSTLRDADVVLLQEAVQGRAGGTGAELDAVRDLSLALGIRSPAEDDDDARTHFFGTVRAGAHRWGLGVLSRHPASFTDLALPNAWWSPWPRGAVVVEIGPWIVVTLHLEVWPIGAPARRKQVQAILDRLQAFASSDARPVVVAGDLNCERGGPHEVLRRAGFEPALSRGPTWRQWGLALQLDHIYVRKARTVAAGVERAATGSDHWPVWIELERGL